jgi:hypothetical protein
MEPTESNRLGYSTLYLQSLDYILSADSDKDSILLWYIIDYTYKKFYSPGPWNGIHLDVMESTWVKPLKKVLQLILNY